MKTLLLLAVLFASQGCTHTKTVFEGKESKVRVTATQFFGFFQASEYLTEIVTPDFKREMLIGGVTSKADAEALAEATRALEAIAEGIAAGTIKGATGL